MCIRDRFGRSFGRFATIDNDIRNTDLFNDSTAGGQNNGFPDHICPAYAGVARPSRETVEAKRPTASTNEKRHPKKKHKKLTIDNKGASSTFISPVIKADSLTIYHHNRLTFHALPLLEPIFFVYLERLRPLGPNERCNDFPAVRCRAGQNSILFCFTLIYIL